jgi:Uncharacterised nucleotidyltransferase
MARTGSAGSRANYPWPMADGSPPSREWRIEAAASALRADAVAAEVVGALDAAGVPAILLKGRSFAAWLYGPGERAYKDCDLLIPPDRLSEAERTLEGLDFGRFFETRGMPEWWGREHATDWYREDGSSWVDLHLTLPDVGVDDMSAWRTLSGETERLVVGDRAMSVLGPSARALHIALHAAHHGAEVRGPMADLERATAIVEQPVWVGAVRLAELLDATEPLAIGLRLTVEGRAIADRLGLPSGGSVAAILRSGSPPPVALGFEQLAAADGAIQRARILARKFVPPRSFMRRWHPVASRGRLGLLWAYIQRPLWLLRASPRGYRAWRAARREAAERSGST